MGSWRETLRRLIDREGHLSPFRASVLRRIDPAEWYMRADQSADPLSARTMTSAGWVTYGPVASGVGTHFDPRPRSEPSIRHWERIDSLERDFGPLFAAKLQELGREGLTVVPTTRGSVTARLLRFTTGTVLDMESAAPTGEIVGHAKLRLEETAGPSPERAILRLLIQKVAEFGSDCQPISDLDPPNSVET